VPVEGVDHFCELAALRQRDLVITTPCLLSCVRARCRVEQGESRYAMTGLPHDFKREIPAIESPASANGGGAVARIRSAIAAMLSS
jgi:hypothetical protein